VVHFSDLEHMKKRIIIYILILGSSVGVYQLIQINNHSLSHFQKKIVSEIEKMEKVSDTDAVFQNYELISPEQSKPIQEKIPITSDRKKSPNIKKGIFNINELSQKEWTSLPGIGPGLAQSIVLYRAQFGDFNSIEDLTRVSHMTLSRLRRIQDYIYASSSVRPHSGNEIDHLSININTADENQLDALPGVGEVIAKAIVHYREENGPFASVDELINVPRIGPKKLELIKRHIRI